MHSSKCFIVWHSLTSRMNKAEIYIKQIIIILHVKFACIWMFRNVNCMTWIQQCEVWNILILNLMKTQFGIVLIMASYKCMKDIRGWKRCFNGCKKNAIPKVDRRKCQAWIYGCSFYKSSTETPWKIVWHGNPVAIPHFGSFWMAFIATKRPGQ